MSDINLRLVHVLPVWEIAAGLAVVTVIAIALLLRARRRRRVTPVKPPGSAT